MSFLKKLKFWEKPRRTQWYMILSEDGRAIDEPLMVLKGCAENEDTQEAWPVDFTNQFKDPELGYMQVASERDINPIPLWCEPPTQWTTEMMDTIAAAETDTEEQNIERKSQENKQFWIILCCVVALGLSILLATFSSFYLQGNLKLPWQQSKANNSAVLTPGPGEVIKP